MIPSAFLDTLEQIVGKESVITAPERLAPYLREQRGRFESHTNVVVLPQDTASVVAIIHLCKAHGVGIVPQGGNTGLVGGAVALAETQIIVNLERMNKIVSIDEEEYVIVAEAGCTLQQVKNAAEKQQRYFPLGLAVASQCHIGGVISTNAGGVNVLRYGTMRELVLGIEAVLPNGDVINTLKSVRKNNIGFDVKQLFIGTEGAFGIVTKATLKLSPLPQQRQTFVLACATIQQAIDAFVFTKNAVGEILSAFELLSKPAVQLVEKHLEELAHVFPLTQPWLILAELASSNIFPVADLAATLSQDLLKKKIVADIVVPSSKEEAELLWKVRSEIPWVQRDEGASIKHDIALPLSKWADFMVAAEKEILQKNARVRIIAFGHLGDGNIHFNLMQPLKMNGSEFLEQSDVYNKIVYDLVYQNAGTFSAEHGIGIAKKAEMLKYVSPEILGLQRALKQAVDAQHLLNPDKGGL
jgi:FAD/FMN-containing dehydrogenase